MRMNSTGVKNENDVHGFRSPAPGRYHVVVRNVDESLARGDWISVEFEILAGTVPGQEHMTHTENMFLREGEGTDQHLRFALVCGLIAPGTEADVNLQHAVGRQLIIGLDKRKSKKDDKEYTNLAEYGMAMWGLQNPEVADVPRMPPPGQQPPRQPMPMPSQPPQGPAPTQAQQPTPYQQPPQQQYAPPPAAATQPAQQSGGWNDI